MIAKFNEDPSSSKRKPDSTIQGTGGRAEKRGRKTGRSKRSRRIRSRKNSE